MNSVIHNLKKREGFTLIELMIVVAIIGILAAIAIPNFIKFQLRAKAGESKVNLAGIRTAQESYFAEAGTYMDFPPTPILGFVPQQKAPFNPLGCPPAVWAPGGNGFCWIGWQPEGDVYYAYELEAASSAAGVVAVDPANGVTANQFYATAVTDIDADGAQNSWGINQPDIQGVPLAAAAAGGQAPLGAVCGASVLGGGGASGPVDSGTGLGVLGQVGPCDSNDMGRNVF
ncbi:MAG: prepilin-type N-terminal cleavage/methylation domain-containing protein [Myxococcota bacterium]